MGLLAICASVGCVFACARKRVLFITCMRVHACVCVFNMRVLFRTRGKGHGSQRMCGSSRLRHISALANKTRTETGTRTGAEMQGQRRRRSRQRLRLRAPDALHAHIHTCTHTHANTHMQTHMHLSHTHASLPLTYLHHLRAPQSAIDAGRLSTIGRSLP